MDGAGNLYVAASNFVYRVDAQTDSVTIVHHDGRSVFVDKGGKVYVAGRYTAVVDKIDTQTGEKVTVAGNGASGFSGDGGPATEASLMNACSVFVDSAGDIYVADYGNNRVRKVDAKTGVITTVAGNGEGGFSGDEGPATDASLSAPTDVFVDGAGNLYIADNGNHRVRKVVGIASPTTLSLPYGIAAPSLTAISPGSGPTQGGLSVTLSGMNFSAGATVTIGGVAARGVEVVSETEITAVTLPQLAGIRNVVVTNLDGQTAALAGGFTYVALSNPALTDIAPDSGAVEGGTEVTLTGTDFASGATVTIGGVAATAVVVVSQTEITAVTPAGAAGAQDVMVANPDGQAATLAGGFTWVEALEPTPDFDKDGTVGFSDFLAFAARFGSTEGEAGYDRKFDLDADGAIGFTDFVQFAQAFGKPAGGKPVGLSRPVGGSGGANEGAMLSLVQQKVANRGEAQVSVQVTGAAEVKGYCLTVGYDASALRFAGAEGPDGSLISGEGHTSSGVALQAAMAPGEVLLADVLAPGASVQNGDLVRLRFLLLDQTQPGGVEVVEALVCDGAWQITGIAGARLEVLSTAPVEYALGRNFPNPFNPETQIDYQLPEAGATFLVIYNMLGQSVRTLVQSNQKAGFYRVAWDGRDALGRPVSSGIYLYRLVSGRFVQTRRMILLK